MLTALPDALTFDTLAPALTLILLAASAAQMTSSLKVKVVVSSRSSMSLVPSHGTQDTSLGASATGAGGSGGVGCGIGIARRHQKREQCET